MMQQGQRGKSAHRRRIRPRPTILGQIVKKLTIFARLLDRGEPYLKTVIALLLLARLALQYRDGNPAADVISYLLNAATLIVFVYVLLYIVRSVHYHTLGRKIPDDFDI